ncbi:MAG: hypothetical protein U0132_05005 [Gemmatimonadaceae bacterium]
MPIPHPSSATSHDRLARWVRAGLLTGVSDGCFSSALSLFFYHSTATRLFQGVAATLLGPSALDGGGRTAAIGLLMHFGVAFTWSGIFLMLADQAKPLQSVLRSPYGLFKVAAVWGPLVWITMSCLVIPVVAHRAPVFNTRWWVQFFGHMVFVGLPMVWMIARREPEPPLAPAPVGRA